MYNIDGLCSAKVPLIVGGMICRQRNVELPGILSVTWTVACFLTSSQADRMPTGSYCNARRYAFIHAAMGKPNLGEVCATCKHKVLLCEHDLVNRALLSWES